MWNRTEGGAIIANFSGSIVTRTKVPVSIGKPMRHLNSPVLTVSDEVERLGVDLLGCVSPRRVSVLNRESAACSALTQQQGPNHRTGGVRPE
jgi:hypothetical protein